MNRIVHKVSKVIASLSPERVKFPTACSREQERMKTSFYEKANYPGIIGLIDGTHIPIQKTSVQHAQLYRIRKSYFSIIMHIVRQ